MVTRAPVERALAPWRRARGRYTLHPMTFTIAHLTDPHLSPAPFPRGREWRLKRFLGWVNWKRGRERLNDMEALTRLVADMRAQNPDHVAMTGDVVNLALRSEFSRAASWMNGLGPPEDVSFTPGNHDAYVRAALPTLAPTFAPWTEGYRFPYLRRRGEIALIGLNTGRPTAPFLATGRLGAVQLYGPRHAAARDGGAGAGGDDPSPADPRRPLFRAARPRRRGRAGGGGGAMRGRTDPARPHASRDGASAALAGDPQRLRLRARARRPVDLRRRPRRDPPRLPTT